VCFPDNTFYINILYQTNTGQANRTLIVELVIVIWFDNSEIVIYYGFISRPQIKKNRDQNQCLVRRGSSDWLCGNHPAALGIDEDRNSSRRLFFYLQPCPEFGIGSFVARQKNRNKIPKLQTSGNIL
jgi:hypothetical protein